MFASYLSLSKSQAAFAVRDFVCMLESRFYPVIVTDASTRYFDHRVANNLDYEVNQHRASSAHPQRNSTKLQNNKGTKLQ